MTKCHFQLFGGSGTIQKFDALCVLGMNIINEKVYVVLWFWFMFLAVVTGITLVVRIVPLLIPSVRPWGAYNLNMITDKFGFKMGDRVRCILQTSLFCVIFCFVFSGIQVR